MNLKKIKLSLFWATNDIKQRYRRSIIGPLWITITNFIFIISLALIYHKLFKMDLNFFLLWIATGIIPWYLFTSISTESMTSVTESENIIKSIPIELNVIFFRILFRNLIVLLHNIIIILIISLFINSNYLFFCMTLPISILLYSFLLFPIVGILAIFATRFRDIISMINSIIQLVFLISPIIWHPSLLNTGRYQYIIDFNPIYHYLQLFRDPLLNGNFPYGSFALIFLIGFTLNLFFIYLYNKKKNKVIFWI